MNDNTANLLPLRLLVSPHEATEQLVRQVERGKDIRGRRIRSRQELDSVRFEKNAWIQSLTQTFRVLFSYATPAEQHVNWTAPILPEYAGLEMFVEQFYEEMDQRLTRLKEIGKLVQSMPGPSVQPSAPARAAQPTDAEPTEATPPAEVEETAVATFPARRTAPAGPSPGSDAPSRQVLLLDLPGQSPEASGLICEFLEKLGLAVLRVGSAEPLTIDPAGAWQLQLARMLKASGIPVDLNRLL